MTRAERLPPFSLQFECERWAPGAYDPEDSNSDVTVTFEDGRTFVGTFFTLTNVGSLLEKWAKSGEYAAGAYFWAVNAVIVRRLDEETIRTAVEDLIRTGTLESALARV
jgi:hypothetical protein